MGARKAGAGMGTGPAIAWPGDKAHDARVGGKAHSLGRMRRAGLAIPDWFVVLPPSGDRAWLEQLEQALKRLGPGPYAVRSSAQGEDSPTHSFAGQFESFLDVKAEGVRDAVRRVWGSAGAQRVATYRAESGLAGTAPAPAVIVQRMVAPEWAGVAFSVDPVEGHGVLVTAVQGLGDKLVSGEVDAATWRVDEAGTVARVQTGHEVPRDRAGPESASHGLERRRADSGGQEPGASPSNQPDLDVKRVADLALECESVAGSPQDIEWAMAGGGLWLLQSRPITTLAKARSRTWPASGVEVRSSRGNEVEVWDNSNIAESYAGVVSTLTFTFAQHAYAEVYRELCRLMRVPEERIKQESDAFETLLGHIDGHVYYNLVSWNRALALLPGFSFNRRFMEQMMGVREELPPEVLARIQPPPAAGLADRLAQARTLASLTGKHLAIGRLVRRFQDRLGDALDGPPGPQASLADLVGHYGRLEEALLRKWDAPLVNDFLAMVFYGLLRQACQSWCDDEDGTLQNGLLCGEGGIVSSEPAQRMHTMATMAGRHPDLVRALQAGTVEEALHLIRGLPHVAAQYDDFIERFGDRCLEELKLESPTLAEDPTTLLRGIGALAGSAAPGDRHEPGAESVGAPKAAARDNSSPGAEAGAPPATPMPAHAAPPRSSPFDGQPRRAATLVVRHQAEGEVRRRLPRLKRPPFAWILRNTRARIRDRENLRFERTRVFGSVRRIFVGIGARLHAAGQLAEPRDVFHMHVTEALQAARTGQVPQGVRRAIEERKRLDASWRASPAPPGRIVTRAGVVERRPHEAAGPGPDRPGTMHAGGGDSRRGLGCCPGIVRGRARVILDPRGASLAPGEILVARRTDPGWILLFPPAAGILVEHGSVLSHAAIVSREMGIPSVVSIAGLTSWLADGDVVELDGRTGRVTRVTSSSNQAAGHGGTSAASYGNSPAAGDGDRPAARAAAVDNVGEATPRKRGPPRDGARAARRKPGPSKRGG